MLTLPQNWVSKAEQAGVIQYG
eukprot:SAG31_NODE_29504_length_394_cov_0.867797_1_plen_21_part_10